MAIISIKIIFSESLDTLEIFAYGNYIDVTGKGNFLEEAETDERVN